MIKQIDVGTDTPACLNCSTDHAYFNLLAICTFLYGSFNLATNLCHTKSESELEPKSKPKIKEMTLEH